MQGHPANFKFRQLLTGEVGHSLVFAEDDHLALFFHRQLLNNLAKLLQLGREIGRLVKQEGRVAEHAHVLDTAGDATQVDLGEPPLSLPFVHQPRENVTLFPVGTCLFGRHTDTKDLIRPLGEVGKHLFPSPAEQDRVELFMNLVQATIAE